MAGEAFPVRGSKQSGVRNDTDRRDATTRAGKTPADGSGVAVLPVAEAPASGNTGLLSRLARWFSPTPQAAPAERPAAPPVPPPPPVSPDARPNDRSTSRRQPTLGATTGVIVLPDGIRCGVWRAWREHTDGPNTTVLFVTGRCVLPAGKGGSRVVLQDAVRPIHQEMEWGSASGKSPVLTLELLVVPPPLGTVPSGETDLVTITYRREESVQPLNLTPGAQSWRTDHQSHYTHVNILPEGVVIAIEDVVSEVSYRPKQPTGSLVLNK
jgi:hypothetical protein